MTQVYDSLLIDPGYSLVLDNSTVNTITAADLTLVEPITAMHYNPNIGIPDAFNGQTIVNGGTLTGDIHYDGGTATGEMFYFIVTGDGARYLIHPDGADFTGITSLELVGEYGDVSVPATDVDSDDNITLAAVCFVRGTLIETVAVEIAVEALSVGDLVRTLDHGLQPIRWIGGSRVRAKGRLAPVVIRAGTLGNRRDLRVSPQHRMLLRGWRLELLFAEAEALAPAIALVNDSTIRQVRGGMVEYFHMLFDRHEIVFAEGAPSESFHPGILGLDSVGTAARDEIFELFPELRENPGGYGPAARMSLKGFEARLLARDETFIPQDFAEPQPLHIVSDATRRGKTARNSVARTNCGPVQLGGLHTY